MKYIRIPLERVGVLIGKNGEVRNRIAQHSKMTITINSELGEVKINDQESEDPLMIFKVENIIRAIGRGFSPDKAMNLFKDDMEFYIFDIHDFVGKKKTHLHRVKSRVIGKNGKTKQLIEELTESHISIYGHTISIIGNIINIDITKKAIEKLLNGNKHATVYRFLEKHMKKIRLQDGF